jgi:hypothetical protein
MQRLPPESGWPTSAFEFHIKPPEGLGVSIGETPSYARANVNKRLCDQCRNQKSEADCALACYEQHETQSWRGNVEQKQGVYHVTAHAVTIAARLRVERRALGSACERRASIVRSA